MDVGMTNTQIANSQFSNTSSAAASRRSGGAKEARETARTEAAAAMKRAAGVTQSDAYGKVIGEPQLSEKASKYYESLKEKYGDMDFILVANDSIEGAEAKAAGAGSGKTMVLIDAEKIERMAEDEEYRKKYEGIIANGKDQLEELAKKMGGMNGIAGFGMRVGDDGKTSFFAISQKNNDDMNARQAERAAAKKAKAKADAKKAAKKQSEEKIKKTRDEKRAEEKKAKEAEENTFDPDDYEIVEADSVEELMRMLEDRAFEQRSNNVMTPEEAAVGGHIDFSL